MASLRWDFDGRGGWDATSAFQPDGIPRDWRIVVCDDGTFDVNESDESLLPARKINCFPNLREAKEWCVNREGNVMEEYGDEK